MSSVSSAVFVAACFFLLMPLQNASCIYLWIEGIIEVLSVEKKSITSAVFSLL